MTEAEWLTDTDPQAMLEHVAGVRALLPESANGRRSERILRLLAAACCRRVWYLFVDQRSRWAVEVAEGSVDGLFGEDTRVAAAARAFDATTALAPSRAGSPALPPTQQERAAHMAFVLAAWNSYGGFAAAEEALRLLHKEVDLLPCHLFLRCIFGNPFRPTPAIDAACLGWSGGTVVQLARTIYDEQRFADLPILADALEEAGCEDADILSHCRNGGEHVRGCWVLDLILGKS